MVRPVQFAYLLIAPVAAYVASQPTGVSVPGNAVVIQPTAAADLAAAAPTACNCPIVMSCLVDTPFHRCQCALQRQTLCASYCGSTTEPFTVCSSTATAKPATVTAL